MIPVRVVLDTNILVSALVFQQDSLYWIRQAWHAARILPLASRDTTIELLRVLQYPKFRLTPDDRDQLLADYLPFCEVVSTTGVTGIPKCRDPFDRPFLALAIAGRADALVSGDNDLLALRHSFKVPIITATELRAQLHR